MKPVRVGRWLCALVVIAAGAGPAPAAWDNVFQVCCHSCENKPILSRFRSAFYGSTACCAPTTCCAPPTCCTTQYVQRSYYQPVTCYQTKTYYEPVTSYRTSYYYEPVTSYRYSCYYDPCTCSYQQVACPTTCYRLRSQCCPVTSYLQRTCQVPVTSYRLSYYYEPVTTCSTPAPCASPCTGTPGVAETPNSSAAPGVYEQRSTPAAVPNGTYQQYYPTQPQAQPTQPTVPPSTQPPPTNAPAGQNNTSRQAPVPQAPPTVRLDRIVAVPTPGPSPLEGQVVLANNAPQANAQLTFVRADKVDSRQPVTADAAGKFNVQLPAGGYLVYMHSTDGRVVFHSQIEVNGADNRPLVLVSR